MALGASIQASIVSCISVLSSLLSRFCSFAKVLATLSMSLSRERTRVSAFFISALAIPGIRDFNLPAKSGRFPLNLRSAIVFAATLDKVPISALAAELYSSSRAFAFLATGSAAFLACFATGLKTGAATVLTPLMTYGAATNAAAPSAPNFALLSRTRAASSRPVKPVVKSLAVGESSNKSPIVVKLFVATAASAKPAAVSCCAPRANLCGAVNDFSVLATNLPSSRTRMFL